MNYSRANPSSRYLDLQRMYREMHVKGEEQTGLAAEKTFPGYSLDAQLYRIKTLIEHTGAQTILDYGCGKGKQYKPRVIKDERGTKWPSVVDFWSVDEIACYDPCYEPFSTLPEGKFDGVISTDVLEHCPEEDIPWIIEEIFGFAARFVFANVACYPARKLLPNGENAHCTIRPVEWWSELATTISARHPGVEWEFWVQSAESSAGERRLVEQKISGKALS